MKKKRLLEFDILRGIAFIFIVIQHSLGGFSFRQDIGIADLFFSKFFYTIATVGVPLFIFLTGISLFYTYFDKFDIKNFYIKKLKFLVLPFFLWSLVLILYQKSPIDKDIFLTIFSGNAQYHLWYMGMILRIYLYFPIILLLARFIHKQNKAIKIFSFLFFLVSYLYILNNYSILEKIKTFLFGTPTDLQSRLINISPLTYYFYFVIGAYFISNYDLFKKYILKYKHAIIILYCLIFFYYYYIELSDRIGNPLPFIKSSSITSVFYRTISIFFIYIVAYYIYEKLKYIKNILIFISRYSFPGYLIHILILNSLTAFIPTNNHVFWCIEYLVIVVIFSVLISYSLNLLPFSEYFIGVKSRFNKHTIIYRLKQSIGVFKNNK